MQFRKTLIVVRYVLPALLTLAGLIIIVIEPRGTGLEGGLGVLGAGIALFLFAFLAKLSMRDTHIEDEEEARVFFDRNGHWPDEGPSMARGRRVHSPE